MRDSALDLMKSVRKVLAGAADAKLEDHIAHREDVLDNVQREVAHFGLIFWYNVTYYAFE